MVLYFGFFAQANQLFNVVPIATENGSVVRYRVIAVACGRKLADNGKFAVFGGFALFAVGAYFHTKPLAKVAQRVVFVEQRQGFVVVFVYFAAVFEVGKENAVNASVFVGFFETAIAGVFVANIDNLIARLIQNQNGNAEVKIFHIGCRFQKVTGY